MGAALAAAFIFTDRKSGVASIYAEDGEQIGPRDSNTAEARYWAMANGYRIAKS